MCAGIRDAWNLSWKLGALLRHQAGPALLETYTTGRKLHVRPSSTRRSYLGRIICIADPAEAAA